MKRYPGLLMILSLITIFSNAQDFPTYGKVTPDELKLKECAFDKEATAVVLLDEAVSNYNENYNLITNRHIRIKILHEKGIEHATVTIPFLRRDDFEFISNVEGMVFNSDNNGKPVTQSLDKKSVFTKNVTERLGEVRFTFPSVKAGSIVEFKYMSTIKNYNGLDDWYFQKDIPIIQSKFHIYIPPNYEFAYVVYKSNSLPIKIEPDANNGCAKFEMNNIPGLNDEPYMDARRDYIQRVSFQLSGYGGGGFDKRRYLTSWDELTKELVNSSSIGGQLNKDLAGTDDFIKLAKLNSSEFEKMKLCYNYVRNKMVWNGYSSIHSPDGVKNAWSKKTGHSGDINLILINILREVGLEVYPMLVSERHNGKINIQYPFVDQFNTVYAAVFIDGKRYYLDATDKLTPPQIVPYSILNTTAFIVNKKTGGLVNIKDESLEYKDVISIVSFITPDETIKGEVFVNSMDYARVRRLERYSSNSSDYVEQEFVQSKSSMAIDDFKMMNGENDSLALQQSFNFVAPIQGTGDYKFIPVNLFSGFERNPFLSDNRFSEINFGYKRNISVVNFIGLPTGYIVDAIPKSVQLVTPDKTVIFTREIIKDEPSNRIVSRLKMDFKKSHYTVDEYSEIKEFYKKMFDMLNEQIVIKKKSNP